jgi:membrane protease YdiL (CAAX protease family)
MKHTHLWGILLANGLFALLANLLFLIDDVHAIQSSAGLWPPVLLGLGVYTIQIILIYYLVRHFVPASWRTRLFKVSEWYWALGIGSSIWLLANIALAYRLHPDQLRFNSTRSLTHYLTIFLLNSFPGAMIEEFLFRYLPVLFAENKGLSQAKTILLFFAVLLFFTATHIPAYLWQYEISLWSLWSPFTMGAAFFFVYYATRNLPFAALFHAFTNNSWVLFGPSEIKDYSLVIIVSILWFLLRTNRTSRLSQDSAKN